MGKLAAVAAFCAICGSGSLFGAPRHHPVMRVQATAFAIDSNPTSSGTVPHRGTVAADPDVFPLGSRIRVSNAGRYSGVYTVVDTGNKINGRHIDIFMDSRVEARRFGKRMVRVQVLETGTGKEGARAKDIPARPVR